MRRSHVKMMTPEGKTLLVKKSYGAAMAWMLHRSPREESNATAHDRKLLSKLGQQM